MTFAANRAAKALMGTSRNRPSRSMSQTSDGHLSSSSPGSDIGGMGEEAACVSDREDPSSGVSGPYDTSSSSSSGGGGGGGAGSGSGVGPSFMRDLQLQYESLSERLAREVVTGTLPQSPTSGGSNGNPKGGILKSSSDSSRRVRWAETARIASTMDGDRATAEREEEDGPPRTPMEVLADLFQRKYTLPIFLVATTAIFLLVHLGGGPDDDTAFARYDYNRGDGLPSNALGMTPGAEDLRMFPGAMTRSGTVDGSAAEGLSAFSLTPIASDLVSLAPTIAVIHHTTPKIPFRVGVSPSNLRANEKGNEEDMIVIETESGSSAFDTDATKDKNESQTTLKWNFSPGAPTPDPALLGDSDHDEVSTSGLSWNYPPGVPTPNPALLVEISPPDGTSPDETTLKNQIEDPDDKGKSALKWNYPAGSPTPDPALLAGVPDQLSWGYPPGVPTPDPILLTEDGGEEVGVGWGYPPGVPTPDPALLLGDDSKDSVFLGWGYPPGEPTPDPAYLNGSPGSLEAPTIRNVETGVQLETPTPTVKEIVTLKFQDMTPETARPGAKDFASPPSPNNPKPPKGPPKSPAGERPPLIPVDHNGNPVEVAPAPKGVVARIPHGQSTIVKPPEVATVPYNGPGGFVQQIVGTNPDWTDPNFGGPNGYNIGGQLGYPGVGGMVIPQMQSSCGCCCCNCGGGSVGGLADAARGMVLPLTAQGYAQHMNGNGQLAVRSLFPPSLSSSDTLGCPWECLIDETVPTKGRSNEDDALYEIFYTNPLNCCGTIVEVGAGDGAQHSTSFFFELGMNWTTHLIEADPLAYARIGDNRSGKKVIATNGAFCKLSPYLYFDEQSRSFQGSTSNDDSSSEVMSKDFEVTSSTRKVDCVRLDTVLAGIDHINVMVIRVKGDPWAVIRTMDWNVHVDIWVILMEQKEGVTHDTARAALKLHDYVPAAWDIKLWCDTPANCLENEVWLRKNFSPIRKPLLQDHRGLRGGNEIILI